MSGEAQAGVSWHGNEGLMAKNPFKLEGALSSSVIKPVNAAASKTLIHSCLYCSVWALLFNLPLDSSEYFFIPSKKDIWTGNVSKTLDSRNAAVAAACWRQRLKGKTRESTIWEYIG